MKTKLISTVFAVIALASFSMPAYSFSQCANIQRIANQDRAAFESANAAWEQACGADPTSTQCSIATANVTSAANTANSSNAAALICRVFYSEN